jgi:hypothetical protein
MRFFVPFFDDSTIIFAATVKRLLEARGHDVLTAVMSDHQLSDRQISIHLPAGPDMKIGEDFFATDAMTSFDAMLTCKAPLALRRLMKNQVHKKRRDRPCYIAFQPGLEFTPERGRLNRVDFDAVFLYSAQHRDDYRKHIRSSGSQHVSFGHPYFLLPTTAKLVTPKGDNIYFFAQAISPSTLSSRQFIVDVLATLARRHPTRKVIIKLRHLPGENATHVHREAFDYPWIIEKYFPDKPENLVLSDCSMRDALNDAYLALTCTSTAVMDAVSAGVPAMIYLSYVENYRDKYSYLMRGEFKSSGLVTPLKKIMNLDYSSPNEEWLRNHFRGDDLFVEIENTVNKFRAIS